MKTVPMVMTVGGLLLASAALAAPPSPGDGEATRAWLELQASGRAASKAERPMDGDAADRVYQRYLDSFSHPIPVQFPREQFAPEGSGS
ncbi:DUF3613 domain-containing protein [Abyssibacter sp.]|jgi:hypothetical protein|uniref:DUF3613 domain-containing protein n=1 Tax=Abyssibacter sp. TaxID=2320200 RepID=UPI003518BCF4